MGGGEGHKGDALHMQYQQLELRLGISFTVKNGLLYRSTKKRYFLLSKMSVSTCILRQDNLTHRWGQRIEKL